MARTGARTSTLTWLWSVAPSVWPVSTWSTDLVFGPPDVKLSVFHPGSLDSPLSVTQRYWTSTGTRPTVKVALKAGACPPGGGQVPL